MQMLEEPPSLSLRQSPRAMVAMVTVTGNRNWLAHGDSQCPMNALHFHTSPGGQRERLTRLFNPRSCYLLRFHLLAFRFVSFRFVCDSPNHSHRTLSLILTLPLPNTLISKKLRALLASRNNLSQNVQMLIVKWLDRFIVTLFYRLRINLNMLHCYVLLIEPK